MAESKTLTGCRSCGCTDLETVLDLGTTPLGSARFSFGPFNTTADVDEAVTAMRDIAK